MQQAQHKVPAAETIAQVRAMFNRNRVAVIYNKQGDETKRVICFAAGMEERDMKLKFERFNQTQRASIHQVIKRLAPAIKEMAGYSLTEFNK
ncbi:Putative uncharacterized protein [Moritella viscosa]|uniref:hypothetical protein n=1 Tax=Moritella viscosa TaxID=80854 RepID=UPI000912C3B4|nr:hypothetical protein [Moritella viscosa]SGY86657.1 Putative uncharacterized protein [Moritella viscosa]